MFTINIENKKKLEHNIFLKKTWSHVLFIGSVVMNTKNKKEEESTEMLRILSWINNIK